MKKTSVRRGLAWILVLVMLLSAVPFGVFAEGAEGTAAENQEAPAPEGSPAGDQENQEPPETPKTPENPEGKETPEGKAETPVNPEGKTGEVQTPANAPATQEGEDGPVVQGDNQEDDTPKCVCDENGDKCTAEEHNEECPVCSKADADYEKCCNGKQNDEEGKPAAEEPDGSPASGTKSEGDTNDKPATGNGDGETKDKPKDENGGTSGEENDKDDKPAVGNENGTTNDNPEGGNNGPANGTPQSGTSADPQTGNQSEPNITFSAGSIANADQLPIQISAFQIERLHSTAYGDRSSKEIFLSKCSNPPSSDTEYVLQGLWSVTSSTDNAKMYKFTFSWEKHQNGQTVEMDEDEKTGICAVNRYLDVVLTIECGIQGIDQKWLDELVSEGYSVGLDKDKKQLKLSIDGKENILSPEFKIQIYNPATVTFHANAGDANNVTLPDKITSFLTGTVDLSQQVASRPGYNFKGWSTSNGADAAKNMITSPLTMNADNIDVYAVWERVKPTMDGNAIHVDITDGELNTILGGDADTLTVKSGAVTDISELLQKLGLDEHTDFKAVSVELLRNGDENKKLTELPSTLCFSMDVSGLHLNILQVQRNHNGWAPLPRLSAKPTDGQTEGYYLDGNTLYIYSKLFSTFAAYSAPYTVSFDAGDGEVSPKSATTDADGKLSSLPTPTRTGYTFDGWYVKNADGTETKVVEKVTVFTDNAKVYAKWTAWTYTVIFDGNGGKVKNSVNTSETVPAVYGSEVTPPEFVKEYYTVSGWARNADGTEKVESPIKDLAASNGERITLYAQWEYAPRTVTFDANGVDNNGKATKGTVTEDGTEKASVTRKTQESPINTLKTVPVPNAQEGYYFEGWYYKDRTGKEQPVEIGKTEFTADTTVYAKWKVFEPVTVTLKCQRGTMTVDGKSVSQGTMQTKWPGVLDGTLPTPARTGYKFQGWYTYAGVKVDENTMFLRDTTIYARWVSAVSRTGNPKTGDQIALEAAVAVLVLAAVGLGAAVIIKKKQNKK